MCCTIQCVPTSHSISISFFMWTLAWTDYNFQFHLSQLHHRQHVPSPLPPLSPPPRTHPSKPIRPRLRKYSRGSDLIRDASTLDEKSQPRSQRTRLLLSLRSLRDRHCKSHRHQYFPSRETNLLLHKPKSSNRKPYSSRYFLLSHFPVPIPTPQALTNNEMEKQARSQG